MTTKLHGSRLDGVRVDDQSRDKDGKFASGGGGSGSAEPEGGSNSRGHELEKAAFAKKYGGVTNTQFHSGGHTKDEATAKAREMRATGTHPGATIWHITGPKTGPKSSYAIGVGPNNHLHGSRADAAEAPMEPAGTRVARFDKGQMKKAEKTPQGFLRAPAYVTRTGVFTYRTGDGKVRRELRHPDDVFDPKSLATLAGVPVTNDHPNLADPDVLMVTPENVQDLMVGFSGDDVGRDAGFVTATLTITKADAIAAVESGKTEVSCGYDCDLEDESGVYDGQPYDARQRNIVVNHIALVDRGRAGPEVRMRLDAADAEQVEEPKKPLEDANMEKITLGGVEFNVTPELKAAIEAAVAAGGGNTPPPAEVTPDPSANPDDPKVDEGDATPPAAAPGSPDPQKKMDSMQARLDAQAEEIKRLKAGRADADDSAKVRAAAKELVRIRSVAERVLPKAECARLDSMSDAEIKAAVIKAEQPEANLTGKSAAYIDARFDAVADGLGDADEPTRGLGAELHGSRADAAGDEDPAEAAKKRQTERGRNAWRGAAAK